MSAPAAHPAPAPADTVETPGFFESGERPVYSVLYAPRARAVRGAVVVHCHSLGVEQLTSYRNEVLTARAAAAHGVPTLRYHARGHGDSAGDFAAVTLDSLVEDARRATEVAKARTGLRHVLYLGVRFGALVAARAAAREPDAAGLILWEPAESGADDFRGRLRALLMSQLATGRRPGHTVEDMLARVETEGQFDVHGYYLHRAIVRSASAATLEDALEGYRGPVHLAQIQARPAIGRRTQALIDRLRAKGLDVTPGVVSEEPGWHFMSNPAWRSAELVRLTAEWIDALA